MILTHNSQVEPWSSGLWGFKIDTTAINSVIAFTHVKDFQASIFRPRAGIKDNAVMPKDVCVHPMAASDISHAGNVDSTSRICKDERIEEKNCTTTSGTIIRIRNLQTFLPLFFTVLLLDGRFDSSSSSATNILKMESAVCTIAYTCNILSMVFENQ